MTVIVESQTTPGDPFLLHEETQVDRDGQFYAMFDFADVPANSTAEVYVMTAYDSVPVASVNATFAECPSFCSDSDARSGVAPDVSGDTLELSDGVTGLTGEPLYLAVGMGEADAATLSVDTGIPGEPLNATLRDNDGDGRVLVELDAAGDRDLWVGATGDSDSAVVFHDPDVPEGTSILDEGTYDARLFRGTDASGPVVDDTSIEITASDSGAGEDQSQESASESGVDFVESSVSVSAGGTATIPVSMAEDGVATLVVDRDTGYEATVVVTDGNSDGEVAVRLDTAATDGEDGFAVVEAADEVAVESAAVPSDAVENESLAAGAYTLQIYDGDAFVCEPVHRRRETVAVVDRREVEVCLRRGSRDGGRCSRPVCRLASRDR